MNRKTVIAIVVIVVVMALAVWGFLAGRAERAVEAQRETPVSAPSRVSLVQDQTAVTLDAASQRQSGVVVAAQQPMTRSPSLQAFGTVLDVADLIALRNSYTTAQVQVSKAAAAELASRAEYQRSQALHAGERDISTKALQTADAVWRSDQASLQAAQAALIAATQTASQQWGAVLAKAAADNATLFMRLATRQEALLQIVLPASTQLVQAPQRARVQTQAGTFVEATLISASPRTDPRLQGASYFYSAPANGLLPGMAVTVYLSQGAPVQGAMIPNSAVVWWQGHAWVYTRDRPDRFVRHELPVDNPVDGGWFVPQGFANGKSVVATGAQLLLSEEQRSRLSAGGDGDTQ